jgi:hypothetical protein
LRHERRCRVRVVQHRHRLRRVGALALDLGHEPPHSAQVVGRWVAGT